jgi:polyhydroxybutyrate depolymerase
MRFFALPAIVVSLLSVAAACGGASDSSVDDPSPGQPGTEGGGSLPIEGGTTADTATPDGPVVPTSPCTGKTGAAGTGNVKLTSGGKARAFDLHVPAKYDPTKRTPVVFVFHGYTMTASGIATATHFKDVADKRGFIVAFPSGLNNSFNAGDCCGTAVSDNVDDVAFTRDMITAIDSDYCVDPKRVFSAGFSNGGFLSYRLACDLADKIAAIAPVAGGLRIATAACNPKRPVPVLHVHGTSDIVVPYNGGGVGNAKPVSESIDAFKTKNTCAAGAGKVVYTKDDVSCTLWGSCAANADVELCTVTGGGHQWPGGDQLPYGGSPSPNLETSEAIADFFEKHPMP